MSTEPLFLDKPVKFEKSAGMKTRLGDSVDAWPQEIVQEAYKQLPFLGRFDAHAVLDKMDEERGFAFGSIEVTPKGERAPSRLSKVHIPVVVKEQMLQPLDIFIHGKRYSRLSEPRLMASLFKPETFDKVVPRQPEPMIGQELFPPTSAGGYGNVGMKTGSAELAGVVPLLPQLDGRVLNTHSDRIKEATRDPDLVTAYANGDEGVQAALLSALSLGATDTVKTASALVDAIPPDVVQMKRMPNGNYLVKWAAIDAYAPQQQEVPPDQAQQMAGPGQLGEQMGQEGEVTAAPGAEAGGELMQEEEDTEDRVADQFGIWRVQDNMGHQLVGWVFPKVYDFSMKSLPVQLFNNGSQYAFQDAIAGRVVGKATDLPKGPPQGYGALYTVKDGTAKVFLPLRVISTFQTPEGQTQFISQTDDGEQYTFYFTDMLKELTQVAEGQIAVPSLYSWMPLKAETELVSDPSLLMKTASRKWSATAELRGDGSTYSWSGPAIAKLARDETKFVDRSQATWVGALIGIRPDAMKVALDRADTSKTISFDGLRQPTPLAEKVAAARTLVKAELSSLEVPIRNYFLLKEASVLDDAMMADKILGLGFINSENVATFVDMLPSLEETSSKMAELLLAIRLGIKEVPETAVERMLVALDDVVHGLRSLQQKELRFGEE